MYSGKLMVTYGGVPGRICSNSEWDDDDATVACKQMGFRHGMAYHHTEGTDRFLDTGGPIWLSNLKCNGHERRLGDCERPVWGNVSECGQDSAGVLCYSDAGI